MSSTSLDRPITTPRPRIPRAFRRPPVAALIALLSVAVLALGACGKAGPEDPKKLPRVENPAMGVAIGAVPPAFSLISNEGAEIHLDRKEGKGEVTMLVERPEVGGVNLPQMVRDWKEIYEGMEEGKYLGQVELTTQFGPAYTVRGSYQKDGVATEERRLFALHPNGDEVLTFVYTYPEGNNSRERTDELFELVTEIESLEFQPQGAQGQSSLP
jgi:hypothetical protein